MTSMITTKSKNLTNNSSSALVVSIMCAVIITIIRQSINNHTNTYAWISSDGISSLEIHKVAPHSPSIQWSRNVVDDITSMITAQKKIVDNYLIWLQKKDIQEIVLVDTWVQWLSLVQPIIQQYQSFDLIKKKLSEKECEYPLPIDNTDSKFSAYIQWWLDHCLLTVSVAQKVYPNDILTHDMMRVIAQRAWFDVKMEYASSKTVSRDAFLSFFYALQQHHKIGDLPVVSMSNPLKRGEYIILLHKIFEDTVQQQTALLESSWTNDLSVANSISNTTGSIWNSTGLSMTVKEFKEILISQWKKIEITSYDDTVLLTPEIIKKLIADTDIRQQKNSSSVWIDKEMMKNTVNWFMDNI